MSAFLKRYSVWKISRNENIDEPILLTCIWEGRCAIANWYFVTGCVTKGINIYERLFAYLFFAFALIGPSVDLLMIPSRSCLFAIRGSNVESVLSVCRSGEFRKFVLPAFSYHSAVRELDNQRR